jgi:hypothetical protein
MKPSHRLALKISIAVIVALLILGYGFFQARDIITGPKITILSPKNGENLPNPLVTITGLATNINRISLNDRQIFVDKSGNFSEKLLVPAGYTIIKIEVQDKFGRTIKKLIELNYTASPNTSSSVATSSATSTQNIIQ